MKILEIIHCGRHYKTAPLNESTMEVLELQWENMVSCEFELSDGRIAVFPASVLENAVLIVTDIGPQAEGERPPI